MKITATAAFLALSISMNAQGSIYQLSDDQMRSVEGQGLANDEFFPELSDEERSLEALSITAKSLLPLLYGLDYDLQVSGVHFDNSGDVSINSESGAIHLPVPSLIEEIKMSNISAGGGSGVMGHLHFQMIRFSPDSSLTVRLSE